MAGDKREYGSKRGERSDSDGVGNAFPGRISQKNLQTNESDREKKRGERHKREIETRNSIHRIARWLIGIQKQELKREQGNARSKRGEQSTFQRMFREQTGQPKRRKGDGRH